MDFDYVGDWESLDFYQTQILNANQIQMEAQMNFLESETYLNRTQVFPIWSSLTSPFENMFNSSSCEILPKDDDVASDSLTMTMTPCPSIRESNMDQVVPNCNPVRRHDSLTWGHSSSS